MPFLWPLGQRKWVLNSLGCMLGGPVVAVVRISCAKEKKTRHVSIGTSCVSRVNL